MALEKLAHRSYSSFPVQGLWVFQPRMGSLFQGSKDKYPGDCREEASELLANLPSLPFVNNT